MPSQPKESQPKWPQSSLPRVLDLSYPSNQYAAGGLLVGILLSRVRGRGWIHAVGDGLAGFAAWATARELDPDHQETAAVSLPLALTVSLLDNTPHPLGSFAVMSGLRVLGSTVGLPATPLDTLALLAQAALSAYTGERVAAAVPGASLALSLAEADRFSPAPSTLPGVALVGAAALLPARPSGKQHSRDKTPKHSPASDLLSLAALTLAAGLARPEPIDSHCDQVSVKVASERIQRSRQLALGALASGLVLRQTRSLGPLAAAVLCTAIRRQKAAL